MYKRQIYNIGKGGISPELVQGVRDALEARELIKIGVLQNCMEDVYKRQEQR